jgi:hypothetical protein
MGRHDAAGQRDVGDVGAIGMDPRIERGAGFLERETLTRAAG